MSFFPSLFHLFRLFRGTVRENIIGQLPFKADKYAQVIDAACLAPDFAAWAKNDETMVTEGGNSVSGGQRQRICLARTLYTQNESEIFLFDDPFASVDVKVGNHIMQKAIIDLLKGKTRIIVFSAQTHLTQFCDRILVLEDRNGSGTISVDGDFDTIRRVAPDYIRDFIEMEQAETPVTETVN